MNIYSKEEKNITQNKINIKSKKQNTKKNYYHVNVIYNALS